MLVGILGKKANYATFFEGTKEGKEGKYILTFGRI